MSGVHFEIENNGNFAELRDRNSTNKTWVNHSTQVKCTISPGDVIRAGKTQFSIQWETLPSAGDVSLLPENIEKTFEGDDDRSRMSRSPIGSGSVSFPRDKSKQLSEFKVREVEEVTNSSARSRNSSPFESLDASYWSKVDNHSDEPTFIPPTQEISQGEFRSPFDESSISKFPFSETPATPPAPPPAPKRPIPTRVTQRTSDATGFDIWAIIEKLSNHCDLRVVSHYRKIGQLTPSNLMLLPVFPFLADSREHLPVIVKASEWLRQEDRQVTNRLVQADGLMLVLTKGTLETESELQELCNYDVSGFSASNGFLGWCWPSQLQVILNSLSDPALAQFFGETIQGFLFPSASNWIAYASPEIMPILADYGFA